VIVATCSSDEEFGMWGEVLSRAAQARKICALVLDSYVRDTRALADVGLAVYARGVSLRKSGKHDPGEHGVALTLGRVTVRPADLLVGDSEGLVLVPSGQEASTFSRARDILSHEAAMLASIDQGATTIELLDLPPDPRS
jgi:4-hydroxy-4-methyl-2-oxoglutarate aldolase